MKPWKGTLALVLMAVQTLAAASFLFDYTKDETAGNADWIIDDNWPQPYPPNPSSPESWTGAISSWGYDLHQMGHRVRTLPPGHSITYGNAADSLDLMHFDVFILCEPQDPLSPQEKQAIVQFVQNGGGLFLVANHNASDRNNNGWDSPHIFNAAGFDTLFGIHFNVTGEPNNNIWDHPDSNVTTDPNDPIIYGPAGTVGAIGYYAGTAMTLWPSFNANVKGHVWMTGASHGTSQVTLASSRYGNGRIVGVGDSSPADDGTGQPGNNLFNGWIAEGEDNNVAFLNASLWLAAASANTPPYIADILRDPPFPTASDTVLIQAKISDDSQVALAELWVSVAGGSWTPSDPDSVSGDWYFFHIGAEPEGTGVAYFLRAVDDSGAATLSDTFSYVVNPPGGLSLQGYQLFQQNSSRTYTFGDITLPQGGILLVVRNATQSDFEAFWGVNLGPEVLYINSGGSFPVINGGETFTLVDADGDTVDGPTVSMDSYHTYRRTSRTLPANDPNAWLVLPDSDANPGTIDLPDSGPGGLFITEFSDASGSGNYVYEFVEIAYSSPTAVEEPVSGTPARGILQVRMSAPGQILITGLSRGPLALYDAQGRRVWFRSRVQGPSLRLNNLRLRPGVYFLRHRYRVAKFYYLP